MSDRLAVLNKGVIQQIDTPLAVYNRPANVFVAGFIGASNLFEGTVQSDGATLVVATSDGQRIRAVRNGEWAPANGQLATAMIRPEQFSLAADGNGRGQATIEIEIEQVVFTGLNYQIHGHAGGGRKVVAIIAAVHQADIARVESGRKARLAYDPAAVHLIAPDGAFR